jgi:glycosyltransferase involved in cell wall biosynthesis
VTAVASHDCSIVVPCFNEGFRIASSLATLKSWFGSAVDVLVIDDGSADDTSEQAARFASGHPQVRVHRLASHRGKGAAIRAAIPLIRTERVVFVDADLAFDEASVKAALDALHTAAIAVGNRRHHHSYYVAPVRLFWFLYRRHLLGMVFNGFVRGVLGLKLRDTQCGMKAYRRRCLETLAPWLTIDGFAIDVEMLVIAAALGVQVVEVPVRVRYESAKSTVAIAASGQAMIADIVRIAIRRARGRYPRRPTAAGS